MHELSRERWELVSPYLDRALEREGEERATWLASLRSEDPALAADVEAMLKQRDALSREGFLDGGAVGMSPGEPPAGSTIGAYTLVSQIGQGGMGSVWLARRSDGHFEGVAAVKLLNPSLVGRAGEERFKRESRILAQLTHGHIAHLIDAGISPGGQPYIVLEYVEGEPIDRYCDARALGIDGRIRLFLEVAAAVTHTHVNLVVHRDIKPSNVLVRTDGQVKLLDFGIAKLLEPESPSGEATALTREGGSVLTPEFAAPEQLTGGPITTATDVYALGVLLYLLLSGRHPAAQRMATPSDLVKAIADDEPPRMSSVLVARDARAAETLSETAVRRATTLDRLRQQLRGDLDTIAAKALKKRPQERYASVTALAEDLQRYLGHQPISARPDALAYRAAKFARRNRVPVALGALAALALVSGLVATDMERRRADRQARAASEQRDFALRQLSRAEAINDLNAFLLSDAAPSGRPFTAGELLARAAHIAERQRSSDDSRVEILIATGRQYDMLDEDARARPLLDRAYALAGDLPDPSLRAKAACALASAIAETGEADRAEKLIREAEGEIPEAPQFAVHRIFCLLRGAEVARASGDSRTDIERVERARQTLSASPIRSAVLEQRVSTARAEALRMAGRDREAAAAFQEAYARLAELGRDDTEGAGTLLNNWGLALHVLGRPLEAEPLFRRAIAISSADGTEHGVSPMLLNNLARTLRELDRLPEAAGFAERAYEKARRAGNENVINQSLSMRASIYRRSGDLDRAAGMLDLLEPRLKRLLPPGHGFFGSLAMHKAQLAQGRGDLRSALAHAHEGIALTEADSQGASYLPGYLLRRSDIHLQAGHLGPALADAARALDLLEKAVDAGSFSCELGRAHLALGRVLQAQGRLAEGASSLASALQHLEPTLGRDHPDARLARRLVRAAGNP